MEVNRGTALFRTIAFAVSQSCTGQSHHRYMNPESPLRLVGGRVGTTVIDWKGMVAHINDHLHVVPALTIEEAQSCNTLADIYKILFDRDLKYKHPNAVASGPRSGSANEEAVSGSAAFTPRQDYDCLILAQQLATAPPSMHDGFGRWIAAHPEHKDGVVAALSNMLIAINKYDN